MRLLSAVVREITRCRTFPLPFFIIMLPFPDDGTGVDGVTVGWSTVVVDGAAEGRNNAFVGFFLQIKNAHKSTINYDECRMEHSFSN